MAAGARKLARGAARIYAVDVGHDQLAPTIANDERVVDLSGTNARTLTSAEIPVPIDVVSCDVSFISSLKVLAPALGFLRIGGWFVTLIKPQFELWPEALNDHGIVIDSKHREYAVNQVRLWFISQNSYDMQDTKSSPLYGKDGNQEFLLVGRKIAS